MYELGISSKFIRILQNLYNKATIQIKLHSNLSELIQITQGVLQGEDLSQLLFAFFINDIWSELVAAGAKGINIDGYEELLLLALADDLVKLCDTPVDV